MKSTHRTLDGLWATCEAVEACLSPIHVEMSIAEAEQLPEPFIELLAEAVDPPTQSGDLAKGWFDKDGKRHRDYGLPAHISRTGRSWFQHGEQHREHDQPAIVRADGQRMWCWRGKFHREDDKPAIINTSGLVQYEWWTHGTMYRRAGGSNWPESL